MEWKGQVVVCWREAEVRTERGSYEEKEEIIIIGVNEVDK